LALGVHDNNGTSIASNAIGNLRVERATPTTVDQTGGPSHIIVREGTATKLAIGSGRVAVLGEDYLKSGRIRDNQREGRIRLNEMQAIHKVRAELGSEL
jgi:hypothetical protein